MAVLDPVRACRFAVLLVVVVAAAVVILVVVGMIAVAVAARASRIAGPPVVERRVLESVAERAAMDAGGRGRGLGGPLSYV